MHLISATIHSQKTYDQVPVFEVNLLPIVFLHMHEIGTKINGRIRHIIRGFRFCLYENCSYAYVSIYLFIDACTTSDLVYQYMYGTNLEFSRLFKFFSVHEPRHAYTHTRTDVACKF